MHLNRLRLYNFKNYEETNILLEGNIHCFMGLNGSGKTNLLDAIHYLSFTKSAFTSSDAQNCRTGQEQFFISGNFLINSKHHLVVCSFTTGKKKVIQENGEECTRFSRHIGKFPVVLMSPLDIELIWDGSELRRKFMDTLISQVDEKYLDALILYTNQLKQRNSYLRSLENQPGDRTLFESYDTVLAETGAYIYTKRKEFLSDFLEQVCRYYQILSNGSEKISILYQADQDQMPLAEALKKNRARDLLLRRTTAGIHRDDFLFRLEDGLLSQRGSQGQQKSFLVALKLAEFQIIKNKKGVNPLLLLDDIFDKLDDERIQKLLDLVCNQPGQLFLTDARQSRCREVMEKYEAHFYEVDGGTVKRI